MDVQFFVIIVNLTKMQFNWQKKSLAINLELYGSLHNEIAVCYNTIAIAYSKLKEFEKAIEYSRKSIDVNKALYGARSNELIVAYYNYCNILQCAELYKEALDAIEFALKIIYELYDDNYTDIDSYLKLKKEIESKL